MAMTENEIKVIIAAELRKQGFDKAAKATNSLEKQFKKLGGTILAVFSTRQIIAFGKASVKAFADDEVAARRLSTTLGNLNLAFEDPRVSKFISDLEMQSGVLDDQLRPAFESLLKTTGSVANSQKLLALAIDVAAGSGQDLQTVTSDLSRAYVGNTRGLIKYNLGLTKSELAGKDFLQIQELLNKTYSGQNAAFLETYTGRVNTLRVAYANMQEEVGKGLVDAFIILAGDTGIGGATTAMERFGLQIANTARGAAILINTLKKVPGFGNIPVFDVGNIPVVGSYLKILEELGRRSALAPQPFKTGMSISGASDLYTKQDRQRKKAEEEAAKRQKQLMALQKKAEEERKKRERLELSRKRAQTIFDMGNIQIVAALQGKIDGEQRTRLVTLLALNTDNYKAAEKLADVVVRLNEPALRNLGVMIEAGDSVDDLIKKLITSQAKLAALQLTAEDFPELDNPFEEWEDSLDKILKMLMQILAMNTKQEVQYTPLPPRPTTGYGSGFSDNEWMRMQQQMEKLGIPYRAENFGESGLSGAIGSSTTTNAPTNVNVYVSGNVTTENDLVARIAEQFYQQQKSGKQIVFSSTGL